MPGVRVERLQKGWGGTAVLHGVDLATPPNALTVPRELDDAARVEGARSLRVLWHVYLPLARPTLVAYGLVSVSFHWNNLLWPLIITNSVSTRPITVALLIFASPDQGVRLVLGRSFELDELGAAARRLAPLPARLRAELHARRDQAAPRILRSSGAARHLLGGGATGDSLTPRLRRHRTQAVVGSSDGTADPPHPPLAASRRDK